VQSVLFKVCDQDTSLLSISCHFDWKSVNRFSRVT
jgi:hypothetical protein